MSPAISVNNGCCSRQAITGQPPWTVNPEGTQDAGDTGSIPGQGTKTRDAVGAAKPPCHSEDAVRPKKKSLNKN